MTATFYLNCRSESLFIVSIQSFTDKRTEFRLNQSHPDPLPMILGLARQDNNFFLPGSTRDRVPPEAAARRLACRGAFHQYGYLLPDFSRCLFQDDLILEID